MIDEKALEAAARAYEKANGYDAPDGCHIKDWHCGLVEAIEAYEAAKTEQPDDWSTYIAKELHYPDCWDTIAYPTVYDAINELASCNICKPPKRESGKVMGGPSWTMLPSGTYLWNAETRTLTYGTSDSNVTATLVEDEESHD